MTNQRNVVAHVCSKHMSYEHDNQSYRTRDNQVHGVTPADNGADSDHVEGPSQRNGRSSTRLRTGCSSGLLNRHFSAIGDLGSEDEDTNVGAILPPDSHKKGVSRKSAPVDLTNETHGDHSRATTDTWKPATAQPKPFEWICPCKHSIRPFLLEPQLSVGEAVVGMYRHGPLVDCHIGLELASHPSHHGDRSLSERC